MKEYPLLFQADMVRAILAGRKTQTRRTQGLDVINKNPDEWKLIEFENGIVKCKSLIYSLVINIKCPFWADQYWARETWSQLSDVGRPLKKCLYRADYTPDDLRTDDFRNIIWKPSFFMPRWASRVQLKRTDIRCERLQEIGGADVRKEGCSEEYWRHPFDWWIPLWDSINGKKHPWTENPWVFVLDFKRIEK